MSQNIPKTELLYKKSKPIDLLSTSEGISLMNVRQVHILEPYWNHIRIKQVIGRAIRICSHRYLPMNERKVDVFRYKCIRKSGKATSDF